MGPDLAWRRSQGWECQPLLTPRNICAGLRVETVPTNGVQEHTGLRPEQRCIIFSANRIKIYTKHCFKLITQYSTKGGDKRTRKMAKTANSTQSKSNLDTKRTSGIPRT